MREIDITKQDIRCCDDFDINEGRINVAYEMWFEVDRYFGTDTRSNNTWINFYTEYDRNGNINALYIIDAPDTMGAYDWELTEVEKAFFKGMMQTYCNCIYRCTLDELLKEAQSR